MKLRITALILTISSLNLGAWSFQELWDTALGRNHEEVESHKYPFPNAQSVAIEGQIGDITIKTWQHDALMVEVVKKGSDEDIADTTVQASISDGVARFTTHTPSHAEPIPVDYTVIIPSKTPRLSIKSSKGLITIKNIAGKVDVTADDGSVDIRDSTASISAHAQGSISLTQRELDGQGSLFLKARDAITLKIPTQCNARLTARTLSGTITSSLYVTLDAITTTLSGETWERLRRFVRGTLGAESNATITLETTSGPIAIREL